MNGKTTTSSTVLLAVLAIAWATDSPHATQESLVVPGLSQPVEILKDRWGISHIYAQSEEDLFFAQGFNAARDRLFQLEMWRRQASGTVAEILGARELQRDIGTRLFRFRGNMDQELRHYHPRGDVIIPAFVRGINAYIERTREQSDLLSIEFEMLQITPQEWTPEIVISRHQGLLGNIGQELSYGRAVTRLGSDAVKRVSNFHPGDPDIELDSSIDGELLFDDILGVYNAFRRTVRFLPGDIQPEFRNNNADADQQEPDRDFSVDPLTAEETGSNNWVVSGALTQSGYPIMANDPHRAHAAPSLRYMVHLVGPGWNVIGGGEPTIPGISIGHNEHGAWGLTVFGTDGEDLYVYDTNPENPLEYRYRGQWERMLVVTDTIAVLGEQPEIVDLKYTRHGPVVYEDQDENKAYAIRAAWMEIGGAPYLASLRMDQAKTWQEFREACSYSNIPGENMVWADRAGNIGWQAVGIAPIRPNWSGLVPVPGDGRYEWDGYLPILAKPNILNPAVGFFGTANNNLLPPDYPYRNAVGWTWSDPFRWARLNEVLGSGRRHSMMDMMRLQTDELSIPARTIVPLLRDLPSPNRQVEQLRSKLLEWDFVLDKQSSAAAIYVAWERRIQTNIYNLFVPEEARDLIRSISLTKLLDWLITPPGEFGSDPTAGRDAVLLQSLAEALDDLRDRLGSTVDDWRYGDPSYKHALIRHQMSDAVNTRVQRQLNVGPAPRGGNGHTLNSTGNGDNQTGGASFRLIVDTQDWDKTMGTNTPGQGGDPSDPHYRDLFDLWAQNKFFPVFFSRDEIERVSGEVIRLRSRE